MNEDERAAGLAATPGYRYADRVGNRLFVAGQVPLDGDGHLVGGGDPVEQLLCCLTNLRSLVELHGFTLADVHELRVHVVGQSNDLVEVWEAVREWFRGEVPPATLLGAPLLGHDGQLVEIEATVERREPGPDPHHDSSR